MYFIQEGIVDIVMANGEVRTTSGGATRVESRLHFMQPLLPSRRSLHHCRTDHTSEKSVCLPMPEESPAFVPKPIATYFHSALITSMRYWTNTH